MAHRHPALRLTVLGDDPIVGHALESLLQSIGYSTEYVSESVARRWRDLPEGRLVLLAPCGNASRWRAWVRRLQKNGNGQSAPVLELVPVSDRSARSGLVQLRWPCRREELIRAIEAVRDAART